MTTEAASRGEHPDPGTAGKTLRADAEQRRQALLCAAAAVFLAEGVDAPLENVARAAGVGIATLYRRFPTRDALVEAVFEAKIAAYADRAEAAAQDAAARHTTAGAWAAFAGYVRDICAMQVADPPFGRVLLRPMQGSALFAGAHARAMRATRLLILHARRAGVVRPDFSDTDLYLLAAATAALVADSGPIPAGQAAQRITDLFLDAVKGPVT
jgi:AcrR family transcriptional regulator